MKYRSKIIRGHGRGKDLGFPTFNLVIPPQFEFDYGVYSSWVWINKKRYTGALHYGPVPTFDEKGPTLEIYVLDYDGGDAVNELRFEIKHFIRKIIRFDTTQALHNQIEQDVAKVQNSLDQSNTT